MLRKHYYTTENPFLDTLWQSGMSALNWSSILSPELHLVRGTEHVYICPRRVTATRSRQAAFPAKGLDTSLKDHHRKTARKQPSPINFDCLCPAGLPPSFQDCFSKEEIAGRLRAGHQSKKKARFSAEHRGCPGVAKGRWSLQAGGTRRSPDPPGTLTALLASESLTCQGSAKWWCVSRLLLLLILIL